MVGLAPGTVCRSCSPLGRCGSEKWQVLALELYRGFHSVGLCLLPVLLSRLPAFELPPAGAGYLCRACRSGWAPTRGSRGLVLAQCHRRGRLALLGTGPGGGLGVGGRSSDEVTDGTQVQINLFYFSLHGCAASLWSLPGFVVPWPTARGD